MIPGAAPGQQKIILSRGRRFTCAKPLSGSGLMLPGGGACPGRAGPDASAPPADGPLTLYVQCFVYLGQPALYGLSAPT